MAIDKEHSMLLDIQYVKANKKNKTPDYLYIIYKDLLTNEKHLLAIPEPKMQIYFEKPEFRNHTYNKNYAKMEEVTPVVCKAKDIIYAIADDMGDVGRQKLQDIFNTGNYKAIEELFTYPYVYGADYDVRVWYRHKWLEEYNNSMVKPITKGFLDIEVDTLESVGLPNPVYNPIDLVTLIDTSTKTSYTFALVGVDCPDKDRDTSTMPFKEKKEFLIKRNMYSYRNKQQDHYSSNPDEVVDEAHKLFDENYPGMEYKMYFYQDERKMLVHLFQLINKLKLDFIGVWNIGFDIPYIIERAKVLGLDPAEFMCHPDFPVKECWFKKDTHNFEIKNKSDFFHISSYTIFYDQMEIYAAIRKGLQELRSYKLTYIGQKEIKDSKLDYSEDGNIKTLSYNNYLKYILYNIKDVLLQCGIEERTGDVETYYLYSYQNITPYESIFKQTVKLRNVQYKSFLKQNLVPGENVNKFIFNNREVSEDDNDDDVLFEGALVGNPLLIDNFGAELFGVQTNSIFEYSVDFDMSAFYPSTIRVMNIDPSALIFKVKLDPKQYDALGGDLHFHGITDVQLVRENKDSFVDDVSKELLDNFQTRNYLSTGYKWFNLPSINEVYRELMKLRGDK